MRAREGRYYRGEGRRPVGAGRELWFLIRYDACDPNLWQIPTWHPDWEGDFTFAGLRTFAEAVLAKTDLGAKLVIIEEGYARLEVFGGPLRIGLVYVNRGNDCAVPQFTVYAGAGDEELTTVDVAAGVGFLDTRRTGFPED